MLGSPDVEIYIDARAWRQWFRGLGNVQAVGMGVSESLGWRPYRSPLKEP